MRKEIYFEVYSKIHPGLHRFDTFTAALNYAQKQSTCNKGDPLFITKIECTEITSFVNGERFKK